MQKPLAAALAFSLALFAGTAHADLAPPDVSGCSGKKAGDACNKDDKSEGTCATSKCSKNDYSDGTPPGTITYDCLVCGAKTPTAPTSTGTSTTTPGTSGSGCSLGGVATSIGPWALALAVPLLLRSRRKRSR